MEVLVAGDFVPNERVSLMFEADDFSFFDSIRPIIKSADYSIVNLECPVTNGHLKPIAKIGPNLSCSEKGVSAIKWAGFKCVTLANNHFYDYGDEGVKKTIEVCTAHQIDVVGGGLSQEDAGKVLYKQINNKTLAIINCCEHEFSIATSSTGGSHGLNPIHQFYTIREAKEHADYVLIIIHGGNEFYHLPSPRMVDTYRFFVDAGADAIINHHQHCFSGYEVYKGKPVFYGLGNFCFDWKGKRNCPWNEGYAVKLFFGNTISFEIIAYSQCSDSPHINLFSDTHIQLRIEELNSIIKDRNQLTEYYNKYLIDNSDLNAVFSPYSNRILLSLCRRHLLPSFVTPAKRRLLRAYIQCESHLPKVLRFLMK